MDRIGGGGVYLWLRFPVASGRRPGAAPGGTCPIVGTRSMLTALGACLVLTGSALSAPAEAQSGGDSTLPTSEPHAIPSYTPNGEPYDHRETEVTLLASDLAGELEGLDGYAGIVISDDEVSFTINWQGVPPDEVVLALARAASAGIDARLSSVDYTSTYLDRLAYETSLLADPTVEQTWLLSASAAPDASGLVVGTVAGSQLHTLSPPEVADLLGIPVPVTVEVGGTPGDGSDFLRPDG